MKASYRIAIALAMVMSLFAGAAALAQGGLTYRVWCAGRKSGSIFSLDHFTLL